MGDLEPKDIIFFLVYGLISISFGIYSLKFKEKAGALLKKCNFGLFSNSFWEKIRQFIDIGELKIYGEI